MLQAWLHELEHVVAGHFCLRQVLGFLCVEFGDQGQFRVLGVVNLQYGYGYCYYSTTPETHEPWWHRRP